MNDRDKGSVMSKVFVSAAAILLVAGCHSPASDTNKALADANSGGNAAAAAVHNAAAKSDLAPLDKAAAVQMIKDRHEKYHRIGKAMKDSKRAIDASPADFATIRASAATIAELAPQVPSWFPKGTGMDSGNKTGAKPDIWGKPDEFAARAKDLNTAAQAFDAAAKSGDIGQVKSAFGNLGKSCKACHDQFRAEDHGD